MSGARALGKRYNYEFPAWIDVATGIGSLGLLAIGLFILLRSFLQILGIELPSNSPWPGTLLYSIICITLIWTAGYLPAPISVKQSSPAKWQPALAESLFLHLDTLREGVNSDTIKIVASKGGLITARFIAQILVYYKWRIELNKANGTHIFQSDEAFQGARIRYRESRRQQAGPIFEVAYALAEVPMTAYFPEDDQFNFSQIEIGDVPAYPGIAGYE